MTRRKLRRARVARNAWARKLMQQWRFLETTALDFRLHNPVAPWLRSGAMRLRGPEQRRSLRALRAYVRGEA